jgi:hypothetical protein
VQHLQAKLQCKWMQDAMRNYFGRGGGRAKSRLVSLFSDARALIYWEPYLSLCTTLLDSFSLSTAHSYLFADPLSLPKFDSLDSYCACQGCLISLSVKFGELFLRLRPRLQMVGITTCDIYTITTLGQGPQLVIFSILTLVGRIIGNVWFLLTSLQAT